MRIFSGFAVALLIAACGEPEGDANSLAEAEAKARSDAANQGQIECAVSGMTQMTRSCTVEREMAEGELILTIRHDDGGFRRFKVMKDGSGVAAADGAEPAIVSTQGAGAILVQVGADKYLLPATVKGKTAAK